MVDALFIDRKNKLLLPKTEVLQELYKELFVAGHNLALRKLHNFLGYYRGHEGENSKKLIEAVIFGNEEEAFRLISQGHYVYDFSKFDPAEKNYTKIIKFFFLGNLHHPNYNILAKDDIGHTPLHWAVFHNKKEIAALLIEAAKGNPEILKTLFAPDNYGTTPLHSATNYKMSNVLLEAAASSIKNAMYSTLNFMNSACNTIGYESNQIVMGDILKSHKFEKQISSRDINTLSI